MLAIATAAGGRVGVADADVVRARDLMTHRGPDGAGLWRSDPVVLAHRRLAVIDPTDAGAQPMVATTAEGASLAVSYNGELYNDAELRRELGPWLAARGARFETACDTETVLRAIERWGGGAFDRLRGMYAVVAYDARSRELWLARDPLGIKPLYVWRGALGGARHVVAASEPNAVLAIPGVGCEPDLVGLSAYLTTIRTVNGSRTLFEGVSSLEPGERVSVDLSTDDLRETRSFERWGVVGVGDAVGEVGSALAASVGCHLRSDVPMCSLLSGGLDSSVIACLAVDAGVPALHTYCSGALGAGEIAGVPQSEDFRYARLASEVLGTRHHEAPVTRGMFGERWAWMVDTMGVPLSTPNEVAIYEVARALRADGRVVALSGEGADELFAGYEGPVESAIRHLAGNRSRVDSGGGGFQLESSAWVPLETKSAVLAGEVLGLVDGDRWLTGLYDGMFAAVTAERDGPLAGEGLFETQLQAHLRFQRRVNLSGLLQRLDSATMLASVEGRTPFADRVVAVLAESLPVSAKYAVGEPAGGGGRSVMTKRAVREAFAGRLPSEIVSRPKASFPLPFQEWMGDQSAWFAGSKGARALFGEAAIVTVAADPARAWRFAWPMMNAARWWERWWG